MVRAAPRSTPLGVIQQGFSRAGIAGRGSHYLSRPDQTTEDLEPEVATLMRRGGKSRDPTYNRHSSPKRGEMEPKEKT